MTTTITSSNSSTGVKPKNRTLMLPVNLDAEAVRVRAKEMAAVSKARTDKSIELESYLKSSKGVKETLLGDLADLDARLSLLGTVVRTEREDREDREVEVLDEIDAKKGVMQTIRLDTNEVVGTRGLTEAERQRSLFEQKGRADAPAVAASGKSGKGDKKPGEAGA